MFRNSPGVDQLSAELQKKSRQNDMLQSTIDKLNTEVEAFKKQIGDLRKDNNAKNTKLHELESANERLARDLRGREQTMQALTEQVSSLKTAASGRSSPVVRSSSGIGLSVSRTASIGTVESSAATNTAETEALRAEVAQLQAEVERLRTTAAAAPAPAPARNRGFSTGFGSGGAAMDVNRMRALNDEVTNWKTRAENLMAELKVAQRKSAAAEAEATRASDRAAMASEAQAKFEAQLKATQAELTQMRDLAQQSTRELQQQLKRSEGESSRYAADADKVGTHASVLQRRLDALLTEKAGLETSTAEALASAAKAKDAARIAQANEQEMAKALDDKSVQVAQLFAELERVRTGKEASDAQFEALTAKLTASHRETAAQEAAVKDISNIAGSANEVAAELERQLKLQRERADAAELAVEAMKSQLVLVETEFGSKSESQRATSDALDSVQSQLDAMRLQSNEETAGRAAAEEARNRLETTVKALQAELGQREATILELTEVLDTMRAEADAKSEALATAQAQATHTEEALGTVKSKTNAEVSEMHATLAGQSDDLDAALQAKEDAENAAREATSAADNARRAALKASQDAEAALQELEEAKANLDAEAERAEALSQLLSDREAELSSLRQQLAHVEAQALQAEALMEQTDTDAVRLKEAGDRYAGLSDELSAAKDEIIAKQKSLDLALGNVKDCERRIEGLQEKLAAAEQRAADLQTALDEAEDRIAGYEQEKAGHAMNVGDARSAQRDSELAAADARRAAEEAAAELAQVREELADTRAQLHAAETKMNGLRDDVDEAKEKAYSDSDWKRRAAELSSELDSRTAELQVSKADAAAEKKRLEVMAAMRDATPVTSPTVTSPLAAQTPTDHGAVAKSLVSFAFDKALDLERE